MWYHASGYWILNGLDIGIIYSIYSYESRADLTLFCFDLPTKDT